MTETDKIDQIGFNIIKKYDKNRYIFDTLTFIKNLYEMTLIKVNYSKKNNDFKTHAKEYLSYFTKILQRSIVIVTNNNNNDNCNNNDDDNSRNNSRNDYDSDDSNDCIIHDQFSISEENCVKSCDEIINFIAHIIHYEDNIYCTEYNVNYLHEDDDSDWIAFLTTTVKKFYVECKNGEYHEFKYVKFDYDKRESIDANLNSIENIYFDNQLIYFDDGTYTKEAKNMFELFNFEHVTFLQFAEFVSYLFETTYEIMSKNFNCDITKIATEHYNYNDDYNHHNKDNIYNLNTRIKRDFSVYLCNNNVNDFEYCIDTINKYMKNYIVDSITSLVTHDEELKCDGENIIDFFENIYNVNYETHMSKMWNDDICKIISFDTIYDNDTLSVKYVVFLGASSEYSNYHGESIENMYLNDTIVSHDLTENTHVNFAFELTLLFKCFRKLLQM